MGQYFASARKVIKESDVDLVEMALSGAVYAFVVHFPQYGDQIDAIFSTLAKVVSDEKLCPTEEELHNKIQKALSDIGPGDELTQQYIGMILMKIDRVANKYLDTQEGFTKEERTAWAQVFENMAVTARLARKKGKDLQDEENKTKVNVK